MERPSWEEYFLKILETVSLRATCDRGKAGALIVKDNRIISTGYVGAPSNLKDCRDLGHLIRQVKYEDGSLKEHCFRTLHAEQNAIIYAARYGVSLENSMMYTTMVPCHSCAMMILASGITKVIATKDYQASDLSKQIFKEANVELKIIDNKIMDYSK